MDNVYYIFIVPISPVLNLLISCISTKGKPNYC